MITKVRKKRLVFQTGIMAAAGPDTAVAGMDGGESGSVSSTFFFYDIMVAVEHMEAAFFMKTFQQAKGVAVGVQHSFQTTVFPEFVAVPEFDILESRPQIVLEGGSVEGLIFQKIVVGISDAPVAVAEENIF